MAVCSKACIFPAWQRVIYQCSRAQWAHGRGGGQDGLRTFQGLLQVMVDKQHLRCAGWCCWASEDRLQSPNQMPSRADLSETEGGTSDTRMAILVSPLR